MRRLTLVLIALAMVMAIAPTAAMADTVVDLIAGQHHDVGDVTVSNDGTNLYVKFDITNPDYYIFKTQVSVKTAWEKIPQAKGNAIPGQFAYKATHDFATSFTQVIPIKDCWRGVTVYIAAHADVGGVGGCVEEICANLPAQVNEEVWPGTDAYMTKTLTNAGVLNGVWDGWCANPLIEVDPGFDGLANVYCSYGDALPAGLIDKPENLDLVNWLMNNSDGLSMEMKQAAIWKLLSDDPDSEIAELGVNPADPALAAIVTEAMSHDGFMPSKGQYVVVMLNPFTATGWVQPNFILVKIVGDETAWAEGPGFPGRNWSMYFSYDVPALP